MATWTTDNLLASIKARGNFPDATTNSLSPAALLNFCTEELHLTLVPMILACRERYYETYQDSVIVPNVPAVPVPTRAVGGVLSLVQYIANQTVVSLNAIDPSQVNTTAVASAPDAYYYENNNLILYPTPSGTGGVLRQRFFQRPNRLEQTINCAQITAVGTTTVTCASVPSIWTIGSIVDFIPGYLPYTPYGLGSIITGIGSGVVTFASLPVNAQGAVSVRVGDWLALSEYTPIPEIPFEFQPYLAQLGVIRGLAAGNDQTGLAAAKAEAEEYHKKAVGLITPRNQSAGKKVVSRWGLF